MFPSYVVHVMEGRARLRHPALRLDSVAGAAISLLKKQGGVRDVRSGAGSLLLTLDPQADLVAICAALDKAVPQLASCSGAEVRGACGAVRRISGLWAVGADGKCAIMGVSPRKFEARSMLGFAGLCLSALASGSKRLHITAGLAWALLTARHVWVRRKAL